jgi:hypothetical protein
LWSGVASACDASSIAGLRSSSVDSVTVQFGSRKQEMPIEDSDRVIALVGFLKRLGTDWAPGTIKSDGVIRFYDGRGVAASIDIGRDAVATGSCKRELTDNEQDELFSILVEA